MRALRIHAYGGPEVMRIDDIPRPDPKPGEALVELQAASVNPIDWKMRQGLFNLPLPRTLGRDGAGIEVASGRRLLGIARPGADGTHAQFALFAAGMTAEVPDAVSLEEAAALGIAGLSAWIALAENSDLRPGDRVLVHGGAGGVGAFAIQIARQRGAEVWTTCRTANSDWCRRLGAAETIDYDREDFARRGPMFDAVFDTVGGEVHGKSADVLKPNGVLAFLNAAPRPAVMRGDIRLAPTDVQPTRERLERLLRAGLKVPIEARFVLDRAAQAYELSRSGHARGKIVLSLR